MNQFAYGSTAQGAVTISTALSLANSQTWTNNSASIAHLRLAGLKPWLEHPDICRQRKLFLRCRWSLGNAAAGRHHHEWHGTSQYSSAGDNAQNHTYTGSTTINGGVVLLNAGSKIRPAISISTVAWSPTILGGPGAFTSGLGTGANQIQITGNSGFGAGNGTSTWRIGTAGSVLVWGASGEGAATGFFNPTTLKFRRLPTTWVLPFTDIVNFDNGIDLNGVCTDD